MRKRRKGGGEEFFKRMATQFAFKLSSCVSAKITFLLFLSSSFFLSFSGSTIQRVENSPVKFGNGGKTMLSADEETPQDNPRGMRGERIRGTRNSRERAATFPPLSFFRSLDDLRMNNSCVNERRPRRFAAAKRRRPYAKHPRTQFLNFWCFTRARSLSALNDVFASTKFFSPRFLVRPFASPRVSSPTLFERAKRAVVVGDGA